MQESLISLDKINDLFKRYTDERMLPAFSKFLDEKSIFKINTFTMSDWRTKNQELLESDDAFTSIYLKSNGDLRLSLLFLIDWKNTVSVVYKLLGAGSCSLDLKKSALLETGNILTGSFFNAVTDKTDFTIMPSIPVYSQDTFSLLSEILEINFATDEEEAILNEIIFLGNDTGLSIKLIIALDANDSKKLS
jgi:chemotaxis protein CheC